MTTIVTHNGEFHADDVFAVAALKLLYPQANIIRTRNPEKIESADIVLDVGAIYNHDKKRYDHHQKEGAGERDDIKYASFGLIWKHYGEKLTDSEKVWKSIENTLVKPIDADDNGISIYTAKADTNPYTISRMIRDLNPLNTLEIDTEFEEAVKTAQKVLKNIIQKTNYRIKSEKKVRELISECKEKYIVFEEHLPAQSILRDETDILYMIFEARTKDAWQIRAIDKEKDSFESKKALPQKWRGLEGKELSKVTNIPDAIFCHQSGFIGSAKTKESAIKMAELAIQE
ncbi:MAG: uncharacterized UPF0160 family protein [Patescibacteria group bacterium]|jgi:uncharacterized UPF0160 family protein